jgi:hypothetical protein
MFGLIDPLGAFRPATELRRFLERILQLPQGEPQVQEATREPRKVLARAEQMQILDTRCESAHLAISLTRPVPTRVGFLNHSEHSASVPGSAPHKTQLL